MADYNSSLPVRTENDGDLSSRLYDGTNELDFVVANSAFGATPVMLPIAGKYEATPTTYDDGDAVPFLTDSNGRLQVDIVSGGGGGPTEYNEDDATPATIVGAATLIERDDALSTVTPAEGDWIGLRGSAEGALWVQDFNSDSMTSLLTGIDSDTSILRDIVFTDDGSFITGTSKVAAIGAIFDDTAPDSVDEGDAGAIRMSANRNLYMNIRDAAGNERGVNVDASNNMQVIAAANSGVDIGDVTVNNTESEPIPVYVTSGAASGSEVNDYDTAAAVAAAASDNHDYTVTGTTLLLKQITAAASGKMKVELQVGPIASLVSKGVWFNSTASPNIDITLAQPIEVPVTGTGTVRLIRTNLESSAQDVYSTIIGSDI